MKNLIIVNLLFLQIFLQTMQAQEKLVPMTPKGDPVLVAKAKELLDAEFSDGASVTILSVEPFDNESWNALFPDSSPNIVNAVVSHPESGHAAGVSFIVSASAAEAEYVIVRSAEPSSFLKALKNNRKRVAKRQDAETIAHAFAALCGLKLIDEIVVEKNSEGYSISLPIQSGNDDGKKPLQVDLDLKIDSESGLVNLNAKHTVVDQHDENQQQK